MAILVCDMPEVGETVEYYTIAGLPGNPTSPKLATGLYGFVFDLAAIPAGTYSIRCSACNTWGCSLPAPLDFTKPETCTAPGNLHLEF